MPPELEGMPDCPEPFEYLWKWFLRLNATRNGGFSVGAISETEMRSFFQNRGIHPEAWEVDLLVRLDGIAMELRDSKDQPQEES
jgi:hypothetical protein